ncbi:MAG: hypothetical protein PHD32_10035 [Eubacteriales bacterium]|nr:hypothetical protein [Eubacteriales bacterium]
MPATMTHLLTAHLAEPDAPVSFFTGSIAPDAAGPRDVKDHTHLRDLPMAGRLPALRALAGQWGDTPFSRGCLLHLFTDYCWDRGPLAAFVRAWPDDQWFLPYRAALSASGIWLFHQTPWAAQLLEQIYQTPPVPQELVCGVTPDNLERFLGHTRQWFSQDPQPHPPEVFPEKQVRAFCRDTAVAWAQWSGELWQ